MKLELLTDQFIICKGTNHIGHFGFTMYVITMSSVTVVTLLLWRFKCKI